MNTQNLYNNSGKIQTNSTSKKIVLLFPLLLFTFYFIGIMVLYVLGPWDWPTHRPVQFYSLLFLYHLAFGLGYLIAISKKTIPNKTIKRESVMRFLSIMIYLNLIYVIFNFMHTLGVNAFSLSFLFDSFMSGISNPAEQYQSKFQTERFGGSYFTYTSVLLAPFFWSVFPLGFYYFKKLSFLKKMVVLMSVFIELSRWIGTGTSKGIFDIIIILVVIILIVFLRKNYNSSGKKKIFGSKSKFVVVITILAIIGILAFTNNVGSRVDQNWQNYSISNGNVYINHDSVLMKICPDAFKPGLIYLTSYLTQGYYGFSISLKLEFVPLFGLGNSMFLMENFNKVSGSDLYEETYQTRMALYGWDPYVNWHSIYVWFANDVHHIGVIFVMFLIGGLLGLVYRDVIFNENPMAIVLLCLLFILLLYTPANNQVLSYPTTFVAFWVLLVYWTLRKKYKIVF
ncbi:hypothetical protein [Bacillus alkalicellulosilyticus]|uniref:hypothetical protein n=1 Tax=Alkalihalobacterium alkalicellulosilyticum TaxID=1912214 RepID=UPI000997705B|nr:hypothetical protein [Bacillus alkalicellulosilyticus]